MIDTYKYALNSEQMPDIVKVISEPRTVTTGKVGSLAVDVLFVTSHSIKVLNVDSLYDTLEEVKKAAIENFRINLVNHLKFCQDIPIVCVA